MVNQMETIYFHRHYDNKILILSGEIPARRDGMLCYLKQADMHEQIEVYLDCIWVAGEKTDCPKSFKFLLEVQSYATLNDIKEDIISVLKGRKAIFNFYLNETK